MELNKILCLLLFVSVVSCKNPNTNSSAFIESVVEISDISEWPAEDVKASLIVPYSSCAVCSHHTMNIIERISQYEKVEIIITDFESPKDVRLTFSNSELERYNIQLDESREYLNVIEKDNTVPWVLMETDSNEYYSMAFSNTNFRFIIAKIIGAPATYNYGELDIDPVPPNGIKNFSEQIDSLSNTMNSGFNDDLWLHFDIDTTGSITFIRVKPQIQSKVQNLLVSVLEKGKAWKPGVMNGNKVRTAIKMKLK